MKLRFLFIAAAASLATLASAEQPWRVVSSQGMGRSVLVDPSIARNEAALTQAAQSACPVRSACMVDFFVDPAAAAKGAKKSADHAAVIARYVRNPATGSDRLLLRCSGPAQAGEKCMR